MVYLDNIELLKNTIKYSIRSRRGKLAEQRKKEKERKSRLRIRYRH